MNEPRRILIVDDNEHNRELLESIIESFGHESEMAVDGAEALAKVKVDIDLVLLDVQMPGMDGFEVARRIREDPDVSDIPIIMVTAHTSRQDRLHAVEAGANDFITKPIDKTEVRVRTASLLKMKEAQDGMKEYQAELERKVAQRTMDLKNALAEVEKLKNRLQAENIYLQQEIKLAHNFEEIIFRCQSFKKVLESVEQVAGTDATVLILGETGTGKELLARAIHNISTLRDRPLVKVDCTSLPANLIESELFGHEKGAFTGALTSRTGRFELADGGTVFLDEIGELPLELQAKLLRVLQEGEFERLGSSKTIKVDVRVIAATNRDLKEAVMKGDFRKDLYYRLNVFPVKCPPLRERGEDLPLLVEHFLRKYRTKIGKKIEGISSKVIGALQAHDWPGNIRELENVVERAIITSRGPQLELGDWFTNIATQPEATSLGTGSILTLAENEREHIIKVLEFTGGKVRGDQGAADLLRIKPTTLEARMKKLDIERQVFFRNQSTDSNNTQ